MREAGRIADARINRAEVDAAARALSLTADALRLDPRGPQAIWNQAIALRWLGLPLAAAKRFDEVRGAVRAGLV